MNLAIFVFIYEHWPYIGPCLINKSLLMKNVKMLFGFVAGCGLMLLVGAKIKMNPIEGTPRYYMAFPEQSNTAIKNGFVYDAVTGEYKMLPMSKIKDGANIRSLLEE